MATPRDRAVRAFRANRGVLRTSEAFAKGIHPRTLYDLRDDGVLEQISRGVYRLASLPDLTYPDLVAVAMRVPRATICLISALAYHGMTTEVPHEVHIALPPGTKSPRIDYPPIRVFRFSGKALTSGVERVRSDYVFLRIYNPAKTVADCFRFRNKLGIDVAIEALKLCIERKKVRPAELLRYARIDRIERVMLPYLQALE